MQDNNLFIAAYNFYDDSLLAFYFNHQSNSSSTLSEFRNKKETKHGQESSVMSFLDWKKKLNTSLK